MYEYVSVTGRNYYTIVVVVSIFITIQFVGPEVIKLFSCSTQLSMKIFPLINVKMPTIVGILTFMSGKNSIVGLSEHKKCHISWYFYPYEDLKFHAQLSWAWKKSFITSGLGFISFFYNDVLQLAQQNAEITSYCHLKFVIMDFHNPCGC